MTTRVIIFATSYFPLVGGAEIAVKEITDRLPDRQFDLFCARIRPGLPSREKIGNVNVRRVGFGHPIDKYLLPIFGPLIALTSIGDKQAPVWSIMSSYGGFAALVYAWLRPRARMLLTLQEGDPLERYDKRAGIFRGLHRRIFQRADAVQAISRFLADWAVRMGFRGEPGVIPNGVDVQKFSRAVSSERREEVRRSFGLSSDDVITITTSRLSLKNGLDDLIMSLNHLPVQYKLLIVGEGEDREKLKRLAQDHDLAMRVVFAGHRSHDELPELLHASDVFVRPSLSEGLGNSFLEAMAAGIPIVGTPVGGIPDFLTDGETGVMCRVRDPGSIARAVIRIQSESGLREKIVTRGAERIVQSYDWEAIARRMEDLFTSLASMRILFATGIYPPESGGPATYTAGLAAALRKNKYETHVIAYGDDLPSEEGVTRVSRRGGPVLRYLRYAMQVFRRSRRADVVYAQGPVSEGLPSTIGAWCTGRRLVMKVVGDYAWEMAQQNGETDLLDEFLEKRHSGVIGIYERIERWTATRAAQVIVPSEYLQRVVQKWGVSPERVSVIKNSSHGIPGFRSGQERGALRDRSGLAGKTVFLTVVRAVPWKGVSDLITWWRELPASHVLIVAGDGPELARWKHLAQTFGLDDRIKFLGRVSHDQLGAWYACADAFVLHSGYEGYPHVIPEAVRFGLPCFVSDKGGNPETANDFPDHVTVLPYRDSHAWISALSIFVSKPDLSAPMRLRSEETMVDETLSVLSLCAS